MDKTIDIFLENICVQLKGSQLIFVPKRKVRFYLMYLAGMVLAPVLIYGAIKIFVNTRSFGDLIFLLLLAMVILTALYNFRKPFIYFRYILDLKNYTFSSIPLVPLVPTHIRVFKRVDDIIFATKKTTGGTSAIEGDLTEFRKTILLETDQGDLRVCTYISKTEEPEPQVLELVQFIKDKCRLTSVIE